MRTPVGMLGIILLCIFPSVIWICLDQAVWTFDPAWYGQVTCELFNALASFRVQDWWELLHTAFGIKAPAIAWLGQFLVPLGYLFGRVEAGLLWLNILSQVWSAWLLGRSVWIVTQDAWAARLAVLIFCTAPFFVAMNHVYFVEPLQTLAVSMMIYLHARGFGVVWPVQLGLSAGVLAFGMAVKASSPLYLVVPSLGVFTQVVLTFRKKACVEKAPRLSMVMLILSGLMIMLTVIWYQTNWDTLVAFIRTTSSGEVAAHYGSSRPFWQKFGYWLSQLSDLNFLSWHRLVAGLAALALIVGLWQRTYRTWIVACLLQIFCVLLIYSQQVNEEVRYLYPLTPFLVLALSLACTHIWHHTVRWATVGIFCAQGCIVASFFLGMAPDWQPHPAPYFTPYQTDSRLRDRALAVVAQTCTPSNQYRYHIVGVEFPELNANTLSFYQAQLWRLRDLHCHYTSLGYAESSLERAWSRIETFKAASFISLDELVLQSHPQGSNIFNQVSLNILARVKRDTHHFVKENLPDYPELEVYRVVHP